MFAAKPTLHGERVVLRPLSVDDADAMLAAMRDPEVLRLTGMTRGASDAGPPLDRVQARSWYGSLAGNPERLDLAILDRGTGVVVGEIVLNELDVDSRAVNLRMLIGPDGRGRGLGSEAIELVLGYAFEQVGLHRISLEVYAFNPRARHVYEKVGFTHEGTKREVLRYDDGWVDADQMAILDHEWRARTETVTDPT